MSTEIHYATGRRKTSSARVYLSKGQGKIMVNDKELAHYFGRQVAQMLVLQPLKLTELDERLILRLWLRVAEVLGRLEQLDMAFQELYWNMTSLLDHNLNLQVF